MIANDKMIKWIEALRSGKYKQGQEKLHSDIDDRYCCLGVLCKINKIPFYYTEGWSGYNGLKFYLGMTDVEMDFCIKWNDTLGFSFEKIADYLEQGKGAIEALDLPKDSEPSIPKL